MSQPWFEYPVLVAIGTKGSKLMFPFEGNIYEVYLPRIFSYDHFDNNGCMGVIETPVGDEYITIEWFKKGVTITGHRCDSGIKFSLGWDRVYPIPS